MTTLRQPELSTEVQILAFVCPECGEACVSNDLSTTLVGYGSPEGHNHDGNCRKFYFSCPNAHYFIVRPINVCSSGDCDWRGRGDCDICGPWLKISKVDPLKGVRRNG